MLEEEEVRLAEERARELGWEHGRVIGESVNAAAVLRGSVELPVLDLCRNASVERDILAEIVNDVDRWEDAKDVLLAEYQKAFNDEVAYWVGVNGRVALARARGRARSSRWARREPPGSDPDVQA